MYAGVGGKETRQKAGQSGFRILLEAGDFSFLQNVHTGFWAHKVPIQWVPGFLPWDKVPEA